ncbi:hypothetical protein MTO96_001309 [Rhipicephalus appendiculatus]
MTPFLALLVLGFVFVTDAASTKTDVAEARRSDSGRTFGALLPLTFTLMPLLAPLISKSVLVVLLSGVAYLALFVGSFFFPALRNRTAGADSLADAWASGWLHKDCARFYKDCDRTSIDSLSAIVTVLGGPDGYFGSLLSRFTNSTAPPTEAPTTASWLATTLASVRQSTTPPPLYPSTAQPSWTTVLQNIVTLAGSANIERFISSQTTFASRPTNK